MKIKSRAAVLVLLTAALGLFVGSPASSAQRGESGLRLDSGDSVLSFPKSAVSSFGISIHSKLGDSIDAYAAEPVQMLVCTYCSDETVEHPFSGLSYSSVEVADEGALAKAQFTSANGSVFRIEDHYKVADAAETRAGAFTMERVVSVVSAGRGDKGFNSEFTIGFAKPADFGQYHFFAPAIWYDHNANSSQGGGFGTNPLNNYFFWRETRSSLPLMMAQDPSTGATLSIAHINVTPAPGQTNLNAAWQVDPSVQYGSIGVQKAPQVVLGFIYPASEGDGSYVGNNKSYLRDGASTKWVRRSHPVDQGFSHTYTLMLSLGRKAHDGSADFKAALAQTWQQYYRVFNPAIADVPSKTVYTDAIKLLNGYVEDVNGATGLPFGRPINPGITPQNNPTYEMGFVGQQIPLGFQLLRNGVLYSDPTSLAHGKAMLDFWASHAGQPSGLPRTDFDALNQKFQVVGSPTCPYPIFLRNVTDGMEGMVVAAIFAREHNMPQPAWEQFSDAFGDWLVSNQNSDGSFYRAYDSAGQVYTDPCLTQDPYAVSKSNTADPIRFLVELYFATGSHRYLEAAKDAGNYALENIYNTVQYRGGTIDNPDVIDKEAGVEAMHGALALLDAAIAEGDGDAERVWLKASQDAADYTETWQYAWNFPIGLPEGTQPSGSYPAYKLSGVRALGIIATGQSSADISLSYASYDFFRLNVFLARDNGDTSGVGRLYQTTANELWNNTKLTTQLSGIPDQQFGYVKNGILGEGVGLSDLLYVNAGSTHTWLPWESNAQIDPIQRLQDTFRSSTLSEAENQDLRRLEQENESVYPAPGIIGWGH